MRRAVALAVLMLLAVGSVAQAAPPVAIVAGHFTYVIPGSGTQRVMTLHARATDPPSGQWTRNALGTVSKGTVTCLKVDGPDAWLAGPITDDALGRALFMYLHDGGSPGIAGDTAFGWITDPGETLADMEALCEAMWPPPFYGSDPFPVVSGNVTVIPAR